MGNGGPVKVIFVPKIVGQAQICGKNPVFSILLAADDGTVPDTLLPQMGPEDRMALIDHLPAETVPAQAKVDLLTVRGLPLPEMYKQICSHGVHLTFPG
jgi:hypothetical protein